MNGARAVRAYHVFVGAEPALTIESRPGRLHSMAALPEGATAPEHPFVHGVSLSPLFEHAMRQILLASADFDDFVARLVAAGHDLVGDNGDSPFHIPAPGTRVFQGDRPVACLFRGEGQLSSLSWQPESGDADVYESARATAYDDAMVGVLRESLTADFFEDVVETLRARGYRVQGD